MVKDTETHLDFVFIASCHSEFATNIFLEAGAQHVIGIRSDAKVQDEAVIAFT
jgi:hypothetical protein